MGPGRVDASGPAAEETVTERPKRKRKPLPRLRNGQKENLDRPRIHLQELGGGRARISFLGRLKPDLSDRIPDGGTEPVKGYRFRGYFVDLAGAGYGLSGTEYDSLANALDDFEAGCGSDERP